jgi:hypothetical protein
MPKDWNPNAPNATQAFNQAPKKQLHSNPVSQTELKALENQRKQPTRAQTPRPPEGASTQANDNQSLEREKRIAYIKNRLKQNKSRSKNGFKRS